MNKRIRDKALKALEDFTLYAQNMPENQLEKVFNHETMKHFLATLVNPRYTEQTEKEDEFVKNRRVFSICYDMQNIGTHYGYRQLNDNAKSFFSRSRQDEEESNAVRNVGIQLW